MPSDNKKKRVSSKYDKENWQYITFKARTGAKERIVEAAMVTGLSVNGFIRNALSQAIFTTTNKTLEPTHEEAAKNMYLRILDEELNEKGTFGTKILTPFHLDKKTQDRIRGHLTNAIENDYGMYEEIAKVLSADLHPTIKGKAIRNIEKETRIHICNVIMDIMSTYPSHLNI